MRTLIRLVENMLRPLYHGSRAEFPIGFVLQPQTDGYVTNDDADEQHHMLEKALERYRPSQCISRFRAVFLIGDPQDIDNAGGYDDNVYECEPLGPVTKCNLSWYSEAYAICEHEILSQQEAGQQGLEYYPDWEEAELKEYCENYWNGIPHGGGDLYEYLTPSARVTNSVRR